jgi:hypothetical protein
VPAHVWRRVQQKEKLDDKKIEVERFTLSSSKPFDQVVAALNSAVGHPDMAEFWKSTHQAQSDAELQRTIEKVLGRTGLMLILGAKSLPSHASKFLPRRR